ncbi:DENN domain protein, partial [Opisthorchis viverrini]
MHINRRIITQFSEKKISGEKREKHMNLTQPKLGTPTLNFICPRLLDYLVVVGRNENTDSCLPKHTPQLLRCYPNTNHKDFELPKEVVFFCQPDGCLISNRSTADLGPESFIFTLTDKDTGKVRFGISLNFFRLLCEDQSDKRSGNEVGQVRTEHSAASAGNWASLTTFCLISHHPFFSKFRKCLHLLKHLVDSAQLFLDRTTNPSQPGQVWSLMTGGVTGQTATDAVCQRLFAEIETWIYRILSTPAPLPERSCVYLSAVPDSIEPPLIFALPDKTRLTLVDFPLHLPLELLGVQTCLKVLTAIMLEQKSRDYNALTMSVMAFTAMLYPLQYMFPAIPLLPTNLDGAENLLLSPTPFLIGIPANFLSQKKSFYIPPDVWLVDLDTNRLMGSSSLDPIPPLPQKEGQELVRHLEHALTSMSSERPRPDDQSAAGQSQPSEIDLQTAVDDVDSVDVATRVAM